MESFSLPPLYAAWIEQLLEAPIPGETRVTCSDCNMCKKLEPESSIETYFIPSAKCCTYFPHLPNFLVGGILRDDDPGFAEGRELFEERATFADVNPLRVGPNWGYRFAQSLKPFGQAEILRCPYYIDRQGGLCGIWRYRNSECSTWFCKFERGDISWAFWKCIDRLLAKLESILSRWSAGQLGLPATSENPNQTVWNQWSGREREFYAACFDMVSALSWTEVLHIGGTQIEPLLHAVLSAYAKLKSDKIPDRLTLGEYSAEVLPDGSSRMIAYSRYDAIDLSNSIVELLPRFDGRPLTEVLQSIHETTGNEIEISMVRRLWEYRILVEVESPASIQPDATTQRRNDAIDAMTLSTAESVDTN